MLSKLTVAAVISGAVLLTLGAGAVSAQYPPPTGSCELRTSATAAETGGNVAVTVTVRDVNGATIPGTPVALAIVEQPGGSILTTSGTATDSAGNVTGNLKMGSGAGTVRLRAMADNVACSAAVAAGTGAVAPLVRFPDTGSGDGSTGSTFGFAGTALLELGALIVVAGWATRRFIRR